ncbi:MAG: PQQ-dependent sugar dehydrogenase [Acidobacteriota bacterium]
MASDAQRQGRHQAGGQIAFAPDGQSLFMTVGDRQRMTPAQDPGPAGRQDFAPDAGWQTVSGQPELRQNRASTISLIDPPQDTEMAKTAKVVSTYTFSRPEPYTRRNLGQWIPRAVWFGVFAHR